MSTNTTHATPAAAPVILSYGLGVDSTAILLRWLLEPETRDFDLANLVVLTAQTGNEWPETGRLVEQHIYPLLREHGIRTVQVARATSSQSDGITILGDTRTPERCYIAGAYTLAEEMFAAGTVPQTGGARLCSVKSKGWCLDQWIKNHTQGGPHRHVIGFEAEEMRRVLRDSQLGLPGRIPSYPLVEWGWTRQTCEDYILAHLGVAWPKSACSFCPYALTSQAGLERTLTRYIAHPEEAMLPLLMEHIAVALNPRQGLIAGDRLADALVARPDAGPLLAAFDAHLDAQPWTVYEVKRAFRAHPDDMMRPANAVRSLQRLAELDGTRTDALNRLNLLADLHETPVEHDGAHRRVWLRHRNIYYPCAEHALVAAPALVPDKVGPGFDTAWDTAQRGPSQLSLLT
ncbi:hypothetical protein [Streptosporangium sp. NPDC051022]|uniref:hypothetical protein n=1 Tax=Streptosporangium sp. NPDC051022 TaxID=3155752 RepID=UPI0034175B63